MEQAVQQIRCIKEFQTREKLVSRKALWIARLFNTYCLYEKGGRTHAVTTAMRKGISLVNALRIKEMTEDADSREADLGVAQTIEEEVVTAIDATIEMGGTMTVIDEETVAEAVVVKIE